ncbi:UDP-N-acetylmuramoylalanyl-D-glutamate--2,6-diaminopimelate ligase [Proteiniborus ethanoligenes]|uniref:UDP-N-acetylmuramoylalanyl-D-glutamate--2,6-diaminopimelate ligase n=1 Tax=Proteiniborus ethanoligenes TaxID=415015 RepID=A0A1H3PAQ4_9FIRM|nr:Mur ligase family protein [Proteiniborus ethanoligenes]SDY98023.1 UDP-N-acetylmuramoylalanyl-D-glutamate--2,6-diaminopimelate ligase [Proteiniborus ethanoligenes]
MKTNGVTVIGITGTNGKTTTSYILKHVLKNAGIRTEVFSSSEMNFYEKNRDKSLPKETIQNALKKIENKKIDVCIIEISPKLIETGEISHINFDIIIHINIELESVTPIERDNYVRFKKTIFKLLKTNGISIINIDDREGLKLIEDNYNTIVLTYGLGSKSSITASSLKLSHDISFNLCIQRGLTAINRLEIEPMEIPLKIKLMGRHNIYNSLAAICGALCLGVNPYNINRYLSDFIGIDRRLEVIYEKEYMIIDNYSHNPSAYEAVFETIQSLDFSKLIIIDAIKIKGNTEMNKYNAKAIASWYSTFENIKLIISLSRDTTEEKEKALDDAIKGYKLVLDELSIDYLIFDTLEEAIIKALEIVDKKDLILLLGAEEMNKGKDILFKKIQ